MTRSLEDVARALVAPGKGILAADESTPTMTRRLASVGLDSTEQLRRRFREVLFTTPALHEHVSGVILFDETVRQHTTAGVPFPQHLRDVGIIPGVKVDAGTVPLAGFPGELATEGLDGLAARLADYRQRGARFVKWRAVLRVGEQRPTATCVETHAHALARYAALAQAAELVPVVEPEVLMDGTHPVERCAEVTATVLRTVYDQLARHRVRPAATLLKPNMVLPGSDCPEQVPDQAIAEHTLAVLLDTVPASVPGVVFLSGGQSEQQATARLDALNRRGGAPWQLSFSFGRALQATALRAWAERPGNEAAAQSALARRAGLVGAARAGRWDPASEENLGWPAAG